MPESVVEQTVEVRPVGGALVLALAGELDLYAGLRLGPSIDRALSGRPSRVVADLSRVTFMDCAGLSLLLRVRGRTTRRGGAFSVYCPESSRTCRILRYVDLDEPLHFVEALPSPG
ncbi:STAS domain-containing protein [Streptomyces sp. NBC_00237]|uniref:STAS domain-containing protein n=1 Tax=Streptomyces sp. NBC_00237 TaxID=2975687 RepID=UPI002253D06D|nr:STAS domain-containing protein [Streptomyces sp. NBC_00237]MCX5204106.1 STAS domain-containing protein [Streptomyces sp. NBC_00237]